MDDLPINTPQKGTARRIARKLLKDAQIKQPPVSLQKVLDFLKTRKDLLILGYDFGEKISGLIRIEDDEITIGFNNTQHWHRRRFTIAHELGHMFMGHTCKINERNSVSEIEAHQFAAELLMPLDFLKKDCKGLPDLEVLSKKYIVSKEALTRHIMECRLI